MAGEGDIKDGEEQSPNWVRPSIYKPKSGTVFPGFLVEANIDVFDASKWQLKIMEGDNQLYFVEESAGQWFSHYVKSDAIMPGSRFIVHVHYFASLAWSQWASLENVVMGTPKPEITEPAEGTNTHPRPRVAGRGFPGATVKLYQAGHGTVLFGTAVVGADGNWETIPVESFFEGPFDLTVNQTFNNVVSEYSETRTFTVTKFTVSPPTIVFPVNGEVVKTNRPAVSGRGLPGATVKLYQANVADVVFGSDLVAPNAIWSITPSVNFPNGRFSLTANQTSVSGSSDFATPVNITVES
jgi:hypothetical protein